MNAKQEAEELLRLNPTGALFPRHIIENLLKELEAAKKESDNLALALWKRHYKAGSPELELCDSVAGVITQIDNMTAGMNEKLEAAKKVVEAGIKYTGVTKNGLHNTILYQDLFETLKEYKANQGDSDGK